MNWGISMYKGYTGKILRVDLGTTKTRIQELDQQIARQFVGGSSLATKFLYDETGKDTAPFSPENPLIFMTGPLTSSGVPCTGRHEIVFRSPLTDIFARSGVGGKWGVELKKAGFDGIIISGQADRPVYIFINDGDIHIKDAGHLWGKDTYETHALLQDELGGKVSAATIGPAGERMARIACIAHEGSHARVAGRCGAGAVMGSKKLKAIAVTGTQRIPIAKPDELKALQKEIVPHIVGMAAALSKFGTAGGIMNYEELGNLPHKNWTLSDWKEGAKKISGQEMARTILTGRYSCMHCPIGCGRIVKVAEGPYSLVDGGGPEYESIAALGSNCLVDNLEAIAKANELCNRYGLDTMSTGAAISFAMEAFEKGLINIKDTGGIDLKWGDAAAMIEMVKKIAEGKDIGLLLGDGVKRAAQQLGNNSIEFAVHVKGLEPSYHDPRCFFSQAISYATTNRGACHNGSQSHSCELNNTQPELDIVEPMDKHQVKGKAEFTIKLQNLMCMFDALVMCKFAHASGAIKAGQMLKFLNLVTDFDMDLEEFMLAGERTFNLQRQYNTRLGISRKDDIIHPRFLTLERDRDKLPPIGQLLSDYYQIRGWSEDGVPTPSTIARLGL